MKIQSAIDLLKVKLAENKQGEDYAISNTVTRWPQCSGQAGVAHEVVMLWCMVHCRHMVVCLCVRSSVDDYDFAVGSVLSVSFKFQQYFYLLHITLLT